MKSHLLGLAGGATRKALTKVQLQRLSVPIPPLAEQRAIAEVLEALDDKVAANAQIATTTETLMTSLVDQYPRTTPLRSFAELSRAQTSPAAMAGKQVLHYSLPAFDAGKVPISEDGAAIKSSKFLVERPSVLLSKLNPRFPRVWNAPRPTGLAVASTEFLVLQPSEIPTAVLWALLANSHTTAFLAERSAGTSGSHQRVRPTEVAELVVSDPRTFGDRLLHRLESLGDLVELTRAESQTLAALRDTLLPALMDGTLRVKDAISQVEEVL